MSLIPRAFSGALVLAATLNSAPAAADPLSDLLTSILSGTGSILDATALQSGGTNSDDTIGLDVIDSDSNVGLGLFSGELLGIGNSESNGATLPLDFLGVSQLLDVLSLSNEAGFSQQLRGILAADGVLIEPLVGGISLLTDAITDGINTAATTLALPGLDDQPLGLALLGEKDSGNAGRDGIAGISLLTPGSSGNGGLIGASVLSGNDSGNGQLLGISVLSGDNSGNGSLLGLATISGSNSGNAETAGVALLSGDNTGSADTLGVGILNGDNTAGGDVGGIAVLNGSNAGNSEFLSVGALNGENSANSDYAAASVLNGSGSGTSNGIGAAVGNVTGGPVLPADLSCAGTGSTGCNNLALLASIDQCSDGDRDGVCDKDDACLDTPINAPVFVTGCHLTEDAALVLRGVNFEFDRAELIVASIAILQHAVKVLDAQAEVLVSVDGHTDSKGSDAYNQRLSYERAATVYEYLVDAGISADRLVFRGFGESAPMAGNELEDGSDNEEGRALNRRVELNILDRSNFDTVKEYNDTQD
ncbi:MAG: OmpA family protein [Spongiibacteraceae bacterium]